MTAVLKSLFIKMGIDGQLLINKHYKVLSFCRHRSFLCGQIMTMKDPSTLSIIYYNDTQLMTLRMKLLSIKKD
jgi:hypothetical protein